MIINRTASVLALSVLLFEPLAMLCGIGDLHTKRFSETLETLAGEYFRGDGFVNETLTLSPEGRVSLTWWADDGGRSAIDGRAEVAGRLLVVHPSSSKSNRAVPDKSDRSYAPVRWGERLYLVPTDRMLSFCNEVNLGLEPRTDRHGQFFVRRNRGMTRAAPPPAKGAPGLPAPWEQFLLKRPLNGLLTEVVREGVVRINLGSEDGIRVGMELWVHEARPHGEVVVLDVHKKDCTAMSKHATRNGEAPLYKAFPAAFPKLAKGQRVTSRIPSAQIRELGP